MQQAMEQHATVKQAKQVQHVAWSLDDAALLVGALQRSERLHGRMSRAVCHLQGPPPRLTLAVYPPQTSNRVVENGESEDGEIDDTVVDPDQLPEEQPDVRFDML